MDCDDDFFGDGAGENDEASSRKISSKLFNDGYRIGKGKEEELQMQIGFDKGFKRGMLSGRACGKLYAACRAALSKENVARVDYNRSIADLEALLFDCVSDDDCVSSKTIDTLRSLVLSISPDLESPLALFENEISELAELLSE